VCSFISSFCYVISFLFCWSAVSCVYLLLPFATVLGAVLYSWYCWRIEISFSSSFSSTSTLHCILHFESLGSGGTMILRRRIYFPVFCYQGLYGVQSLPTLHTHVSTGSGGTMTLRRRIYFPVFCYQGLYGVQSLPTLHTHVSTGSGGTMTLRRRTSKTSWSRTHCGINWRNRRKKATR
jgi:hypothetical protein